MLVVAGAASQEEVWAVDENVLRAESERIEVLEKISPCVVAIHDAQGVGVGSGVLISPDGYVLTNYHVSSGAGDFMQGGLNDGHLYEAVVVGIDPVGDVALVKMIGRDDFPTATLGDSDLVKIGDWCYAIGNPLNLASDLSPTVTYGIVSGTHRYQYPAGTILEYTDCLQTDASINPGNSGGPLFNSLGELIGINGRGSFEKRGRVNSGAGYAISINQIKYFIDHLRSGRIVDHATLGATVGSDSDGAVRITGILESSEAYRRGLRIGDELISFAGRSMGSVNQFKNVLGIYPKGWMVPVIFRRDGRKSEVMVRLQGVHGSGELEAMVQQEQQGPGPKLPGEPMPENQPPSETDEPAIDGKYSQNGAIVLSEEIQKLFVKKAGYSNYYFNETAQRRLIEIIENFGDFPDAKTWKLTAASEGVGGIQFGVNDEKSAMVMPGQQFLMMFDNPFTYAEPPNSEGFLLALHQYRMMMTLGKNWFSECYYLGSEPLNGRGQTVDVLVTERSGIISRWLFSRDGRLTGLDVQRGGYEETCSVRFGVDQITSGKLSMPRIWTISIGGSEVAEFSLLSMEVGQ